LPSALITQNVDSLARQARAVSAMNRRINFSVRAEWQNSQLIRYAGPWCTGGCGAGGSIVGAFSMQIIPGNGAGVTAN